MRGTAVQLVVCFLLWSLVEVHSQTAPYVTFMGETLPRHAYLDLSLVGNASDASDSVQCHTDLNTCCGTNQGEHRGDWYFLSGDRLGFSNSQDNIYEYRAAQRVDLRRRNNGDTSGIIYIAVILRPLQSTVMTAMTSLLERQCILQDCISLEAS